MRPFRPLLLLAAAAALATVPVAAQAKDKEPAPASAPVKADDHGDDGKPKDDGDENAGDDEAQDDQGGGSTGSGHEGGEGTGGGAGAPADPGAPAAPPDESAHGSTADDTPAPQPATVTAPNVDPRLAAVANDALARDPQASLHVLVFGRSASDAVSDAGGTPRGGSGAIAGATIPAADLAKLADGDGVAYVMLDLPVLPTAAADTAAVAPMPFAQLVGAPAAWRRGLSGKGVGIAVIDSGVTPTTALAGRRLVQVRLDGREGALDDSFGHGTFVAGIAAGGDADHRGVAPGAAVYAVNVARGDGVYTSDVLAGLEWVLANHARRHIRVVTLSLQETAPSSYRANPLDTVVEQLWRAGVVVVASAGNLGPGAALFAPANDPFVVSVGALDTDGRPAAFSTSGTTPDGFAKPELLAPGRHIVSTLPTGTTLASQAPAANLVAPGYAMMSGTSMSAPQVAAAAAILLQQHPSWKPDQVKWVLVRTSWPLAAGSAGSLDVARAVAFPGRPGSANRGREPATFGLRRSTATLRRLRDEEMPEGSPTFDDTGWSNAGWSNAGWANAGWANAGWSNAGWANVGWN